MGGNYESLLRANSKKVPLPLCPALSGGSHYGSENVTGNLYWRFNVTGECVLIEVVSRLYKPFRRFTRLYSSSTETISWSTVISNASQICSNVRMYTLSTESEQR